MWKEANIRSVGRDLAVPHAPPRLDVKRYRLDQRKSSKKHQVERDLEDSECWEADDRGVRGISCQKLPW